MLDNQPFPKKPLIGISRELFVSKQTISGLDYDVLRIFRERICPAGVFKFVFFTEASASEEKDVKLICNLGVSPVTFVRVVVGNAASERYAHDTVLNLDFAHLPKLSKLLALPQSVALTCDGIDFVKTLEHFCVTPMPYSRQSFSVIANDIAAYGY